MLHANCRVVCFSRANCTSETSSLSRLRSAYEAGLQQFMSKQMPTMREVTSCAMPASRFPWDVDAMLPTVWSSIRQESTRNACFRHTVSANLYHMLSAETRLSFPGLLPCAYIAMPQPLDGAQLDSTIIAKRWIVHRNIACIACKA